nr:hypothetical protein [Tanacetum cinerariifolium]
LYCRGKENGVNILKSIDEGPYKMGTFRETLVESTEGTPQFGPERPRVYSDLNSKEKDRYNVDIWAINILLQGLPKDIYTLINHYTNAKDIWDNVKMLLEGSELTKEDREAQLYDDFKHFRQHKGESIHEYYVRYVTAVKLNKGLRDSNYDQLYAYLKQHETHAKENKMILERFSQPTVDPLALLSNVSNPQHYSPSSSASSSTQVPPPLAESSSPAEDLIENLTNTLALLTQNAAGYGGAPNRVRNDNQGQARTVKCYNCNGTWHITRNCTLPKRTQNSEYFKDKMLLMQAQENGVALDAEQLLFLPGGQDNVFDDDVDEQPVQDLALNVNNVFQANDCDAFDSNVDEAPIAQTMFMANLSSAYPITDEAGPSYDSDILSEVPDYEHYLNAACVHHEGHVTHNNIQLDHFVDSHADYTSNSHMIPYDHYVRDNEVPVVHSGASSVPTDAFIMIYNDMFESHDPSISNTSRNTVVKNSLTAELTTYKEYVELDLHSTKLQLASTINHNKSMVEEVSFLKKDFKQKENKHLADFLDMKTLKEKVEDKLIKQDQSLQTVHMLYRPRLNYNELNRVAIGYKNPLYLTRAKQVQPALYNGHEIIKENHTLAIVHNYEDTLEIAEITRKKMNDKMNDPECVTRKALTKEVKEMKDVFEELEAEVAQYAVDKKPRFTEMYVANTTAEARCLALEAELANLRDTSNHDNQKELINHFSKIEGKDNIIRQLKKQLSQLQVTRSDTDRTLRVQTTDSHITKLTDQVTNL